MHREARLEARLPHRQPAAKQAPPQARFLLQDLLQDRRALRPCLLCRDSSEGRRKPRRDGSKANRRRGRRPARRLSFRAASGRPFALRMTASRTARGRGETFPAARRKGACAPLSDRQRSEPQIVHQVPRPRLDRSHAVRGGRHGNAEQLTMVPFFASAARDKVRHKRDDPQEHPRLEQQRKPVSEELARLCEQERSEQACSVERSRHKSYHATLLLNGEHDAIWPVCHVAIEVGEKARRCTAARF
jgi:hypothetical protein